jgi:transcriptional regulator with XRE-family HTH domain
VDIIEVIESSPVPWAVAKFAAASLISMLEAGKRKPSREFLERFTANLGVPFHLLILLASDSEDSKTSNPEALQKLALELARLLFRKGNDEEGLVQDKTPEHCI